MTFNITNQFMRTYYQIGTDVLEGYVKLINGTPAIYDLDFNLVQGATQVQSPIEPVSELFLYDNVVSQELIADGKFQNVGGGGTIIFNWTEVCDPGKDIVVVNSEAVFPTPMPGSAQLSQTIAIQPNTLYNFSCVKNGTGNLVLVLDGNAIGLSQGLNTQTFQSPNSSIVVSFQQGWFDDTSSITDVSIKLASAGVTPFFHVKNSDGTVNCYLDSDHTIPYVPQGTISEKNPLESNVELDLLKSELIPVISNNEQYYLQEKTIVDNTSGTETVTRVFYDVSLNVVNSLTNYRVGNLLKNLTYYQVYYSLGGIIKQGFTALDNTTQRIYDLEFNELIGAVIVEKEESPLTIEYTGNDNEHFQLNAGSILIVNDVKCIGGHIKGKCKITINNKTIEYDAGDPFPSFNSEQVLKNEIIIQQITNHSLIFTLK